MMGKAYLLAPRACAVRKAPSQIVMGLFFVQFLERFRCDFIRLLDASFGVYLRAGKS